MAEIDIHTGERRGWRFGPFTLDTRRRELLAEGEPVALNGRYFDALVLLLAARGAVVGKETFLEKAWKGVPVTDEALTQAIRTLRKALGDDAAAPTYIATIPKHGYRFVGSASSLGDSTTQPPEAESAWHPAAAGAFGGALAGVPVGVFYGTFAGGAAGGNALSALLVLVAIAVAAGALAGLGITIGVILAQQFGGSPRWARLAGAIAGGAATGALGRMLALDGFGLMLGSGPASMTGALEGAAMGLAVGLGLAFASGTKGGWRRPASMAGGTGAVMAAFLPLAGGRMLGGSLSELGSRFGNSRLEIDSLGALFGEPVFGPLTLAATGAIEAFVFCACVTGAFVRFSRC